MSASTMTSKGQMTIPKDIRDKLGLQPKDVVHFTLMPDGTVIMRAKKRSAVDLYGAFAAPGGRKVSLEEMNPWCK